MKTVHVQTKDLPDFVKSVLRTNNYNRPDVAVVIADGPVSVGGPVNDGQRGYTVAVDLATGNVSQTIMGSWGGGEGTALDRGATVNVPQNFAVIDGETGHVPYARIIVAPGTMAGALPEHIDLTDLQRQILGMVRSLNSRGRKDECSYRGISETQYMEVCQELATMGLVKINKAGAVAITTKGRNA